MILAFGAWQVIAILVVALLLFGGKKIPELMKGLGKGMKEFKDASKPDEANPASDTEEKTDQRRKGIGVRRIQNQSIYQGNFT